MDQETIFYSLYRLVYKSPIIFSVNYVFLGGWRDGLELRIFIGFPEDLGLIASTYMAAHNPLLTTPVSDDPIPFSSLPGRHQAFT